MPCKMGKNPKPHQTIENLLKLKNRSHALTITIEADKLLCNKP